MRVRIQIINGPNLNLLGIREPEKYGASSFEEWLELLKSKYPGVEIDFSQSNIEGELVSMIQEAGMSGKSIILNPAAYTHTSVAVADAVAAVPVPVIEVHITNVAAREEFRHNSLVGRYCRGSILGLGLDGYRLALEAILEIKHKEER